MAENLYSLLKACGCELIERLLPRIVVAPDSSDSISLLISLAQERRLRLCPMGKGTSFPANYEPAPDTIFILTLRFNQILELRPRDSVIVAEAGLLISDLIEHVHQKEYQIPAALSSYPGTLGGALLGADHTGIRLAELKRRLLGLELINGQGKVIKFGGLTVKNVAGFDYWTFLIGSQGRFGLLTKIYLNLQKMPPVFLIPPGSYPAEENQTSHWIYANLLKKLDPDGIFAR